MRAIVIANCQAQPISDLIKGMQPSLQVADPIILHLAVAADADRHHEELTRAVYIFAQLTSDAFKPDHLSTQSLRSAFSGKVIVWPNIFYAGQQPFLRYFTHPEGGRMLGPCEAMYDLRWYRTWLHTGRVEPEAVLQADPKLVAQTARESLAALRKRDALADVAIADLIDEDPRSVPIIYTFNHPRSILLAEVANRLLEKAGFRADAPPYMGSREPLGRYRVPGIDTAEQMYGDPWPTANGGRQPRSYSMTDLAAAFQALYDAEPRFRNPKSIRLTPTIGWEHEFLSNG